MPAPLLMSAARAIQLAGTLTRRDVAGIHPDRVKKVMISTNVSGEKLGASEFYLEYSLEDAIIDWFEECDGTLL
jgi:GlcNAc-P-P-Und epimerase